MPKYPEEGGIQLWDCFSAIEFTLFTFLAILFLSWATSKQGKRRDCEIEVSVCLENDSDGLNHIVNGCAEEAKTKGPVWVLLGCSLSVLATNFVNQKVR